MMPHLKTTTLCFIVVIMATISAPYPKARAESQILTIHSGPEPQTFDPHLADSIDAWNLINQIFEGLVRQHPTKLTPLPGAAERWDISPDGKIYTFHLRKGLIWSDGSPLTAFDFVYAWERAINPKTGSDQGGNFYYIKNAKAYNTGILKNPRDLGFKALDAQTLRVELTSPFPALLDVLMMSTFVPVKKDVIEKYGDAWFRPEHMVSNGPFLLQEWKSYERVTLVKNPHYWDANNVHLDKVICRLTEDYETALRLYQSNELSFDMYLPAGKIPELLRSHPDFHSVPTLGSYSYYLNTKRQALQDRHVRQALSLAIDRKTLIDKILRIPHKIATGMIVPGIPGYPYETLVMYDPVRARQELVTAGFGGGKDFPVLTLSYNTNELNKIIAESIQQMWKINLGINVNLQNQEWKTHLASLDHHEFDIARLGGIAQFPYPSTTLDEFLSSTPGNYSQWTDPRYDALWDEADQEADPKKRLNTYAKMEKLAMEAMPRIPIYFQTSTWLVKPSVKNLTVKPTMMYVLREASLSH